MTARSGELSTTYMGAWIFQASERSCRAMSRGIIHGTTAISGRSTDRQKVDGDENITEAKHPIERPGLLGLG